MEKARVSSMSEIRREPRTARGGSERPHRLNVTSANVEPNLGDRSMTSMVTSGESRRIRDGRSYLTQLPTAYQ